MLDEGTLKSTYSPRKDSRTIQVSEVIKIMFSFYGQLHHMSSFVFVPLPGGLHRNVEIIVSVWSCTTCKSYCLQKEKIKQNREEILS